MNTLFNHPKPYTKWIKIKMRSHKHTFLVDGESEKSV